MKVDITDVTSITYSGNSGIAFTCGCGEIVNVFSGNSTTCDCGYEYHIGVRLYTECKRYMK